MSGTIFQHPANSYLSTLSAQHTAGGTLALQAGDGAKIGALGANEIYRVTVLTAPGPTETVLAILESSSIATDTLSATTAVEGTTDGTFAAGVYVTIRATAKTFSTIATAVNNLEVVGETSITTTTTLPAATLSMAAGPFNKSYVCSGTSANYAVTLPDLSTGTYDGLEVSFRMSAALTKLVTITAAGSQLIDGSAARILWAGETCTLVARGGNWYKTAGKTIPMMCQIRLNANQTIANGVTGTPILYNQTDVDNTGLMATLAGNGITVVRPGSYHMFNYQIYASLGQVGRLTMFPSVNSTATGFGDHEVYGGVTGSNPSLDSYDFIPAALAGNIYRALAGNSTGGNLILLGSATAGVAAALLRMVEIPQW